VRATSGKSLLMIGFTVRSGVFAGDFAVDLSAGADSFASPVGGFGCMWMITKDVLYVANRRH
jgi:hypothetical protein